ncbi:H-NS histone family protein [Halomonas sp. MM17-34]|jgi:DNA-binding protein H-NS|uniref:H-NS histone family protein n=1 Tax=Halomonas sp. MM17-34 TaxID=2917742 RepID=UPI001EF4A30F|nr:H-NS histone family protein [Halomonas sp. MM17-34]MCG7605409.1 H-NS histone family protein [Halomonas sp. MM17-34]|tara:strand:+ start:4971 stop:5252 length:282 start_codon:yes stop_codon:yes gene_type:complete
MSSPDEKKDRTASTKGQPEGRKARIPVTKIEFVPLNAQAQAGKTNTNAKYRDPDNPFHTWTGIGKRPKWLRSYLEQGRKLEEFLIEQDGEDDG